MQFGDAQHGWAIPYEEWRGLVRHVLQSYEGKIALQHAKFDAGFLMRDGMPFPWDRVHDTMPMMFLADSLGPKSLKAGSALYVDPLARAGEAELSRAMVKNRWGYGDIPVNFEPYWGYAALDTVLTARLAEVLWSRVQPFREAYDLEMACERVLCDMERRGVRVDVEYCKEKRYWLLAEFERLRSVLGDINPNAPQQVAEALVRSGATLTKRTETGQPAVDDEVLSSLAGAGSQVASNVLEARTIGKLLGSYFDNFLEYHDDGVLHPHINQLAARTGRMSVTEPALQTIPRKAIVRDAFVPREGNKLVLVDYDNQELRVAAHFSGDEQMLRAFNEGRSLHDEVAERLYGPGYTKAQRSTAKNANFSKAYGAGVDKFAWTAGIPVSEANAVYQIIDQLYPGIGQTMSAVTSAVRARSREGVGYVVALDGRHLRVKVDKAYVGFNALIQGSCAVVLKRALVDLDAVGLGDYLALPIHDEVMFDVPEDRLDDALPAIREVMTREDFRAPLTVSAKVLDRWGDPYR